VKIRAGSAAIRRFQPAAGIRIRRATMRVFRVTDLLQISARDR
jgi:hypothetical protein